MNRDDSIAFACTSMCLEIGSVCAPAMQPPTFLPDSIHAESDLVTWLVEGGRFLTLIQTARGTRVYDTQDDFLYYAAPHLQLPPGCPAGHAFLCQTVQDRQPDGTLIPRLLVTDLVSPRIECPRQRSEALRGMAHFLPSVCHIQWSGNRAALQSFVDKGAVPHRVAGLVALRSPLVIVREPATGINALNALASGCLIR